MSVAMKTDLGVANEILRQLGGNKFLIMTGARYVFGGADFLSFHLPSNFAKDGINTVRVTLTADDYYTMDFGRRRGSNFRRIAQASQVCSASLRRTFTEITGLDTSL